MRWWYRFAPSGDSRVRSAGLAWLVVPLLLIVTIPVADHFLPPDVHLAHLLVVALAFTAAIAGPRLTALVGGLAVAAIVIAGADRQTLTTESVLVEVGSLVLLSVLLVAFSAFRVRRHLELLRVRRVSDATQGVVRFVTAVLADIPDHEPVVHLVSCGHPAPLRLHGTAASALEVPEPAPPLGLGWLSANSYVPATFPFDQDDRLLLYTDGVTETRDRKGVFYPLAERVTAWSDDAPAELVQAITDDLLAYAAAPLKDDMALVVVRREEPAAADA